MDISSEQIKALRDTTGISVMQCKKALVEAAGDMDKALVILRKKGGEAASKKSDRTLGAGSIGSYVHSTHEVAALVALSSETDFVAKNEAFVALARDLAMQVAAANPKFLSRDEVTPEELAKAKEVFMTEVVGKPAEMQEKILAGKIDSYYKEQILLEQSFIKDPDRTVTDLINDAIQKFGEKVEIHSFKRMSIK